MDTRQHIQASRQQKKLQYIQHCSTWNQYLNFSYAGQRLHECFSVHNETKPKEIWLNIFWLWQLCKSLYRLIDRSTANRNRNPDQARWFLKWLMVWKNGPNNKTDCFEKWFTFLNPFPFSNLYLFPAYFIRGNCHNSKCGMNYDTTLWK